MTQEPASRLQIIVGAAVLLLAVVLVVLGAAFGPAEKHLQPSQALGAKVGREVVVGGVVVGVTSVEKHPSWAVVELADRAGLAKNTVKVEFVGGRNRKFPTGSRAVFVGTVKHRGIVRARNCVKVPDVAAADQAAAATQ
ncbi:MAG: cytochrome c maturation protein CcmE [Coriobacteriales bacterium]|nr:cytochrome c maturation protein CcmE [Coriobacteriales bacterium]